MSVQRRGLRARPVPPRSPDSRPAERRLVQVRVEIGGRVYEGDLAAESRVPTDPDGLSAALAENPARTAWWAAAEALALTQAEQAENARARLYAELFSLNEAVLVRTDADGKRAKPTVDAVKSAILKSPDYQRALVDVTRANEAARLMRVARDAMRDRKDSLLEVARNYRAELDASMKDSVPAVRARVQALLRARAAGVK